jgi:CRISPR/Cas system CSM-associated protein Csm2 small subunit
MEKPINEIKYLISVLDDLINKIDNSDDDDVKEKIWSAWLKMLTWLLEIEK